MDKEDALHVVKSLNDARHILQQLYEHDPERYNVMVEIVQCKEAEKIMYDYNGKMKDADTGW